MATAPLYRRVSPVESLDDLLRAGGAAAPPFDRRSSSTRSSLGADASEGRLRAAGATTDHRRPVGRLGVELPCQPGEQPIHGLRRFRPRPEGRRARSCRDRAHGLPAGDHLPARTRSGWRSSVSPPTPTTPTSWTLPAGALVRRARRHAAIVVVIIHAGAEGAEQLHTPRSPSSAGCRAPIAPPPAGLVFRPRASPVPPLRSSLCSGSPAGQSGSAPLGSLSATSQKRGGDAVRWLVAFRCGCLGGRIGSIESAASGSMRSRLRSKRPIRKPCSTGPAL